MQFNLQENIERQNELSARYPKTVSLPFNSGREVALARKTRNAVFPSAIPAREVNLMEWINYWIEEGSIDTTGSTVSASNVSYIPLAPLVGTDVQVALQELTTLYNDSPEYTFTNGLTDTSGTISLGGTLVENTTIDGDFNLSFLNTNLTLYGSSNIFVQTPDVIGGSINPLNRILKAENSSGGVEYSSFKIPSTNGTVGQVLVLDADNETLVWGDVAAGTIDHGTLSGLDGDDHPQYHNDTRGDARYYQQSEVDTLLLGKADTSHTHALSDLVTTGTADATTYLRGDGAWTVPTPYTAGNGITEASQEFSLGGTLTDNVTFNGDSNIWTALSFSTISFGTSTLSLVGENTVLQGDTTLKVRTPNVVGSTAVVGQVLKLSNVDGTSEWVDEAGAAAYTFDNGLTNTAGTITWGGTLTDDTDIAGDGFTLTFDEFTDFIVSNADATSLQGSVFTLEGTALMRIKTPAVVAATATVGQVLELTNATTGAVEFATPAAATTYLGLSDTPASFSAEDIVPTINTTTNALEHNGNNLLHTSSDNYISMIPTDGANSISFTLIPENSTIVGSMLLQIATGTIEVTYDDSGTSSLTLNVSLTNAGNKYTGENSFMTLQLREDGDTNWITPDTITLNDTGKTYVYNSSNPLDSVTDFEYKIILQANI